MYGSALYGGVSAAAAAALSPSGISSAAAVGSPTLAGAPATLSPTGIPSAAAVGTPTLSGGVTTLRPSGIASAAAVGSPTLTGAATLSPSGIPSAAAVGSPTLAGAPVTLSPAGIASSAAVGTPTLSGGAATLRPSGIASAAALGVPAISGVVIVTVVPGRNQFRDPATGYVYTWQQNHREEQAGARIRAVMNMQPTMGRWRTVRAIRQQGARDSLLLKLAGRAPTLAQHQAFLHFMELSLSQTIIFVHAADPAHPVECLLSDYEPQQVYVPRGPRGENYVWDYTMQLDMVD